MKLIVMFLTVACIQLKATTFAQQVTLKIKNASLPEVFDKIYRQTGYQFIYTNDLLEKSKKVTVNMVNEPLGKVLDACFAGQPFTYLLKNKTIIIRPKENERQLVYAAVSLYTAPPHHITGTVTDSATGMPLPGVSIVIKNNSKKGTSTDAHGNFELDVEEGATLAISYVGYDPKEIKVTGKNNYNIMLSQHVAELEQFVAIGYGTTRKSEVTGSMSNVSGKDIADKPVTSFENALNGKAPGVNMTASEGVANQAPVFRIRGTNSLSLSSYPLIVIDGVPMYTEDINVGGNASNNPLSSIDPDDIESVNIAKDAAATSIYGSRAANGVVFITTKSGKKGKAKVTYNTYLGVSDAARLAPVLNAKQYLEIKNEGLRNAGTYDSVNNYYGTSIGPDGKVIDTRWYDYIFRTGISQNHNVSLSGANDRTTYYFSAGYTKRQGIVRGNDYDRKSVDYNIDHKVNDWLKIGTKTNVSYNTTSAVLSTGLGASSTSANSVAYRLGFISAPIVGPYNRDGSFNVTGPNIGIMDNQGHLTATARLGYTNPVLTLSANQDNTSNVFLQSSNYVQIQPVKWMTIKTLYGINNMYSRTERYFDPRTNEGQSANGSATGISAKRETTVWTNTIDLNHDFGLHSFDLLLGEEEQTFKGDGFGLRRSNQSDPYYTNLQGGFSNVAVASTDNEIYYNYMISMFSRLQYNYDRKYYLSGNFRRDQTSVLGANNKSGSFWGFSGAWQVNREKFWESSGLSKIFNSFKVNASYGKVGNIGGIGDYASLSTYSADLYGGLPGLYYSSAGNQDLKWETSKKLDIGINFSMFNNRLTADISYYKNNIDGLIFSVPVPSSAGLPGDTRNAVLSNVGSMYNKGLELSLDGNIIDSRDFTWTGNFNLSYNNNKVTALAPGVSSLLVDAGAGMIAASLPGYPVGMIYAIRTDGVDPATGRRIFLDGQGRKVYYQQVVPSTGGYQWEYEDGSQASPVTTTADAVVYKNTNPKFYGGLSNTFHYGNFDLDVLITYQWGGYMYYATQASLMDMRFQNNSTKILDRWQKPGDITDVPRVVDGDITSWGYSTPLTCNVYKSDYARLKNLTLGYTLPKSLMNKIKFTSIRVYASAQNLAIVTSYPGSDPEITSTGNASSTQGFDKNMTPNARTFTFGIQVGF